MGKLYSDRNLIRYEDTIQLHFDQTGKSAWLTMKNYGMAFHMFPWAKLWHEVNTVTIGISARGYVRDLRGGTAPRNTEHDTWAQFLKIEPAKFLPYKEPISIGKMLDTVNVIRFQVRALEIAHSYSHEGESWRDRERAPKRDGYTRQDLNLVIEGALGALDPPLINPVLADVVNQTKFFRETRRSLREKLKEPPGALWIADAIKKNRKPGLKLSAYFPRTDLIIQEQRTVLKDTTTGKTKNQDMRLIEPLPFREGSGVATSKGRKADHPTFQDFFKELDSDRVTLGEEAFKNKNANRAGFLNPVLFPNGAAYLHSHVDRIDCYAFRGDTRDPIAIHAASGFLPGVTRKDQAQFKEKAEAIDRALTAKVEGKEYRELLKNLDILTLAVYTSDQDFKAFISTTTSIAIGKCFANKWAKAENLFAPSYLYAVRCTGGFHLGTDVAEKNRGVAVGADAEWSSVTDAKNRFTHFAEQEVTVAGAIWWHNVVGTRLVRIDKGGQFFSGPVFLKDWLRSDLVENTRSHGANVVPVPDDEAFGELFELLSGKSQGQGFEIEWSYQTAPFNCPDAALTQRSIQLPTYTAGRD